MWRCGLRYPVHLPGPVAAPLKGPILLIAPTPSPASPSARRVSQATPHNPLGRARLSFDSLRPGSGVQQRQSVCVCEVGCGSIRPCLGELIFTLHSPGRGTGGTPTAHYPACSQPTVSHPGVIAPPSPESRRVATTLTTTAETLFRVPSAKVRHLPGFLPPPPDVRSLHGWFEANGGCLVLRQRTLLPLVCARRPLSRRVRCGDGVAFGSAELVAPPLRYGLSIPDVFSHDCARPARGGAGGGSGVKLMAHAG